MTRDQAPNDFPLATEYEAWLSESIVNMTASIVICITKKLTTRNQARTLQNAKIPNPYKGNLVCVTNIR